MNPYYPFGKTTSYSSFELIQVTDSASLRVEAVEPFLRLPEPRIKKERSSPEQVDG